MDNEQNREKEGDIDGAEAVHSHHSGLEVLLYSFANANETDKKSRKVEWMNVLSKDIGKVKQPRKPRGRWRTDVLLWS